MDNRIKKSMDALNQLSIFIVNGLGVEDYKNSHQSRIYKLNLNNIVIKSKKFRIPRFLKRIFMLIEMNVKFYLSYKRCKPNIIHINDHHLLLSILVYRIFNKKLVIVYDAHEIGSQLTNISSIESFVITKLERWIWPFLYSFISPSTLANQWYVNRYGCKKNIVLRNVPVVNQNLLSTINTSKGEEDQLSFVYVGSLVEGRGIEMLISLFSHDDIKSSLSFIGYGKLENYILEKAKLNNRIHHYRAVPFDELINYLKSFDFDYGFALIENTCLNEYYCSPNKLFEYANAEIKVVATNLPEMASIIKKHRLGHVVDFEYDSVYKLVKALENKEIVDKDAIIIEGLTWDYEKSKIQDLYLKMVE